MSGSGVYADFEAVLEAGRQRFCFGTGGGKMDIYFSGVIAILRL